MQKGFYIGLLFLLSACNWFAPKETLKASYVAAQLKTIDWEAVDQFPLFAPCDETAVKTAQRECFEKTVKAELYGLITKMNTIDSLSFSGSFNLSILVNSEGKITVENLENPPFSEAVYSYFKIQLEEQFKMLNTLSPAIKQGIPVATRYQIPVEIHLD